MKVFKSNPKNKSIRIIHFKQISWKILKCIWNTVTAWPKANNFIDNSLLNNSSSKWNQRQNKKIKQEKNNNKQDAKKFIQD